MDSFLSLCFLFEAINFKNVSNAMDISKCKNGHLKQKYPDCQQLLWDLNLSYVEGQMSNMVNSPCDANLHFIINKFMFFIMIL